MPLRNPFPRRIRRATFEQLAVAGRDVLIVDDGFEPLATEKAARRELPERRKTPGRSSSRRPPRRATRRRSWTARRFPPTGSAAIPTSPAPATAGETVMVAGLRSVSTPRPGPRRIGDIGAASRFPVAASRRAATTSGPAAISSATFRLASAARIRTRQRRDGTGFRAPDAHARAGGPSSKAVRKTCRKSRGHEAGRAIASMKRRRYG